MDFNLKCFGEKIKELLFIDVINVPGAGAAGGLGAGLMAFCNATIHSGIDKVLDIADIDKHFIDADLVITGEGKIDGQSIFGKVPIGVANRAKRYDIPVIAIVGSVGEGASDVCSYGIDLIIDIIDKPMTLEYAMENVSELLEKAATNAMMIFYFCRKIQYK